jgi:hypothetical protein
MGNENPKKSEDFKTFKWQGPDGAIHTVSAQKQREQAAEIAAHNVAVKAAMTGVPLHGLRKPRA